MPCLCGLEVFDHLFFTPLIVQGLVKFFQAFDTFCILLVYQGSVLFDWCLLMYTFGLPITFLFYWCLLMHAFVCLSNNNDDDDDDGNMMMIIIFIIIVIIIIIIIIIMMMMIIIMIIMIMIIMIIILLFLRALLGNTLLFLSHTRSFITPNMTFLLELTRDDPLCT